MPFHKPALATAHPDIAQLLPDLYQTPSRLLRTLKRFPQSISDLHGLDVTRVIAEGNPATEILGQAEQDEYDLIVLGASGATDMKHRMLGSVSAKVTGQTACSVAVVK